MKNKIKVLVAGALACATVAGVPVAKTSASSVDRDVWEHTAGFTDFKFFSCVFGTLEDIYNAEGVDILDTLDENGGLTDEGLAKVTGLSCSAKEVLSTAGLEKLVNLEMLDLSNNAGLGSVDLSNNVKLEFLSIYGTGLTELNVANNVNLESIAVSRALDLTTAAYAEKTDAYDGYEYAMDMSGLKFLAPTSEKVAYFETKDDIPTSVEASISGYTHNIQTRGGVMAYTIFSSDGKMEVDTESQIYADNNCVETLDGTYTCHEEIYYGDTFDSDVTLQNVISKIVKSDGYKLAGVDFTSMRADQARLDVDTDMVKKGTVLADASVKLYFYYEAEEEEAGVLTPDTGFFTKADGSANFTNILAVSAGVLMGGSILLGAGRRVNKHNKMRRFRK